MGGGGCKDIYYAFFGNVVRGEIALFRLVVRNGFAHFVRKVFARRKLLPGKFWVFPPLLHKQYITPLRSSTVARTPCPLPTFNTTAPPCQNRSTRCQTSWEDHYPTKSQIKSMSQSKAKEVQSHPASLQATEVPQALDHQVQECLEVPRTWTVLLPTR